MLVLVSGHCYHYLTDKSCSCYKNIWLRSCSSWLIHINFRNKSFIASLIGPIFFKNMLKTSWKNRRSYQKKRCCGDVEIMICLWKSCFSDRFSLMRFSFENQWSNNVIIFLDNLKRDFSSKYCNWYKLYLLTWFINTSQKFYKQNCFLWASQSIWLLLDLLRIPNESSASSPQLGLY